MTVHMYQLMSQNKRTGKNSLSGKLWPSGDRCLYVLSKLDT